MLIFNRPSFRSGVMVLKIEFNGHEYGWILRASDKGKSIDFGAKAAEFGDDAEALVAALLAKYPAFLSAPV